MTEERDPFDDTPELDESDEDFDRRAALSDDDETDSTVEEEGAEEETRSSDPHVNAVMDYIGQQETAKEREAAEKAEFAALVEQNMPGYQAPTTEELAPIERVAQKVAAMNASEFNEFKDQLARANQDLYERYNGGGSGDDGDDGEPDVERFDPTTLDSEAFRVYMRAAASGGAIAAETPSGFTRDEWRKAVASSLGRE